MTHDQIIVMAILLFTPIIAFIITVLSLKWYRNFRLVRAYRAKIIEMDKYGFTPLMILLHLKHPVDHQGNPIFIDDILPGRRLEEPSVQQALTTIYMEYDVSPNKWRLW